MQNGDTTLHISAAMGRRKLTRVLLESGCDREMKNKQNETAMEIAKRKSLAEIIQILNSTPSISINPSEKYGESVTDKRRFRTPTMVNIWVLVVNRALSF